MDGWITSMAPFFFNVDLVVAKIHPNRHKNRKKRRPPKNMALRKSPHKLDPHWHLGVAVVELLLTELGLVLWTRQ
jgi:hypothetical protein